jgi:hypothetical protein
LTRFGRIEKQVSKLCWWGPRLGRHHCDRRDWVVLSVMGMFRQSRRIVCQLEPRISSCLPTVHAQG